MINDGIEGPYQLEVDYIAMSKNAKFTEIYDTLDSITYSDVYDPWEPINMNSGN